jgi:hypothetical protein
MSRFSSFLGFFLLLTSGSALADERTEESFIPNYAVASSYFSWSGDADFSDVPGQFSQREAGIEANVPVIMREGFRLTAGVQYRWNQFGFSGAPGPLGSSTFDLDRVDLPMNLWKDFNDRWKMWVRLQPGWYSDFGTVNSDDFILTSLALLSHQWTDTTRVAFGGYYSRDLGEERLLPAVGFIFEPDAHWSLALTFPRVELAYAPRSPQRSRVEHRRSCGRPRRCRSELPKHPRQSRRRSPSQRPLVGLPRRRDATCPGNRDHRSALPLSGRPR